MPSAPLIAPPASLVDFVLQHAHVKTNVCSRQRSTDGFTLKPRTVPDYNVIFVMDGVVVWVIDDVEHEMPAGGMVLVPPGAPHHGFSRTPRMDLVSYHADVTLPGGQDALQLLIPPRQQVVLAGSRLDTYLRQGSCEHERDDPMATALMLPPWVQLIMLELIRDNFQRGLLGYRGTDPVVIEVLEELVRRVGNPSTTLPELASFAGYSPQHLNRVFRRDLGVTPLQYLTRLRMQRAAALLVEGVLTVRAIARSVGYEDPYYFSRLFKQHYEQSPAQYRAQAGSDYPSDRSTAPFSG